MNQKKGILFDASVESRDADIPVVFTSSPDPVQPFLETQKPKLFARDIKIDSKV